MCNETEPTSGHRVQWTSGRIAGAVIDRTLVGDVGEWIAGSPDTYFDAIVRSEKHLSLW